MSKFCSNCGNPLDEGGKFCGKCGASVVQEGGQPQENVQPQTSPQPQQQYQPQQPQYQPQMQYQYQQQQYYAPQKNIIQEVSGKIKVDGIIWIVIACIQYILGLATITTGYGVVVLIVAVVNTVASIQDFKFSKQVLEQPVGIVDKYEPLGMRIANLIYNILFGGLIGVAGSIYGFILRNYVVTNKQQFLAIQNQFCEAQRAGASSGRF